MKVTKLASCLLVFAVLIVSKAYAAGVGPDHGDPQGVSLRALVQDWYPELLNGSGELDLRRFDHQVALKAPSSHFVFGEHDLTIKAVGAPKPSGSLIVDLPIVSGNITLTLLAPDKIHVGPITITTGSKNVYLSAAYQYKFHDVVFPGNTFGTVVADPGASIVHGGEGRVISSYGSSVLAPPFGDECVQYFNVV